MTITFEDKEVWNESIEEFIKIPGGTIEIEHSLRSMSKWESKYHKPFMSSKKSVEELLDYIQMMIIGGTLKDSRQLYLLSKEQVTDIVAYIEDPMTATTFSDDKDKNKVAQKINDEIITNELIYYYMSELNIPYECETWHLSRLITLIRVCSIKREEASEAANNKGKNRKLTSAELASRKALMDARRAKYHTNG